MTLSATPPPLARSLVRLCTAPDADRESILGDLEEEFATVLIQCGPAVARRWYWSQVLRSLRPLLSQRTRQADRVRRLFAVAIGAATLVGGFVLLAASAVTLVQAVSIPPVLRWPIYLSAGVFPATAAGYVTAGLCRESERGPTLILCVLSIAMIAALFTYSPERQALIVWLVWIMSVGMSTLLGAALNRARP